MEKLLYVLVARILWLYIFDYTYCSRIWIYIHIMQIFLHLLNSWENSFRNITTYYYYIYSYDNTLPLEAVYDRFSYNQSKKIANTNYFYYYYYSIVNKSLSLAAIHVDNNKYNNINNNAKFVLILHSCNNNEWSTPSNSFIIIINIIIIIM